VTAVLDVAGAAAPPRSNGELVFAEPWESRAFGMAVTLADAGVFTWDEFRDALVARIAAWEAEPAPGEDFHYYRCWLGALEDRLRARTTGTVTGTEVGDYRSTSTMPTATTAAAITRLRPKRSPRNSEPMSAPMTMLLSRRAAIAAVAPLVWATSTSP